MLRLFGLGVGIGAGVQAFRNFPPDSVVSPKAAAITAAVAILCAFFAGGRRASAVAVATAEATATASNQVNVAVVVPGRGAGTTVEESGATVVPSDSAPWLAGPRPELTADDLDGFELSEFVSEHERDVQT